VTPVPQSLWGTTLNSDRISTQFLNPNIITPKS
jgi:hypothetical protein